MVNKFAVVNTIRGGVVTSEIAEQARTELRCRLESLSHPSKLVAHCAEPEQLPSLGVGDLR